MKFPPQRSTGPIPKFVYDELWEFAKGLGLSKYPGAYESPTSEYHTRGGIGFAGCGSDHKAQVMGWSFNPDSILLIPEEFKAECRRLAGVAEPAAEEPLEEWF